MQNAFFRLMPEKAFAPMGLKKEDAIRLTRSMRALDFSGRLRDISCITLVACGEKDSANKKAAENLAQAIPRATLHMIKNAGHEVNTDAPKALAALLDALAC